MIASFDDPSRNRLKSTAEWLTTRRYARPALAGRATASRIAAGNLNVSELKPGGVAGGGVGVTSAQSIIVVGAATTCTKIDVSSASSFTDTFRPQASTAQRGMLSPGSSTNDSRKAPVFMSIVSVSS